MRDFCYQCAKANLGDESERAQCPILGRMMGWTKRDAEYPDELTYDENNDPTCTAFRHQDDEAVPERCPETFDMFKQE